MNYTLHTSFSENLQGEWNALLDESVVHVPFLRYEYLKIWWQTSGGGEWSAASPSLSIVTAHRDGQLVGAAPLFYLPERKSLMLVGSVEISDYLDVLARPEDLPEFLSGLLPFLASPELPPWQTLELHNLLDSSPTLPALQQAAASLSWNYQVEPLQHSPYIPLPGDWETYLEGIDKKQRHEIRRKIRRAEAADVPTRWYVVKDPQVLDQEIEAFLGLMAQDGQKAAFLTPAMCEHMRLTMRCAFEAGCLNLAFFEVDGKKAAAYLSFDYLNRLWVYNSASTAA